jgi:hypothetical protein
MIPTAISISYQLSAISSQLYYRSQKSSIKLGTKGAGPETNLVFYTIPFAFQIRNSQFQIRNYFPML